MQQKLTHAKVREFYIDDDGTISIKTNGIFEQPSSFMYELEKHIKTSRSAFLSDIIDCLSVISDGKSKELTLTIRTDENYMPTLITKTYLVEKESFNKR